MANDKNATPSIFRPTVMNRLASPDDLDRYIKVTKPSAWVVLIAAVLLIIGFFVWSNYVIIPTTVRVTGIVTSGHEATVYVNDSLHETLDKLGTDKVYALVEDKRCTVSHEERMPLSKQEVLDSIPSAYAGSKLTLSDWNYPVTLRAEEEFGDLRPEDSVAADIVLSETHPTKYLFN